MHPTELNAVAGVGTDPLKRSIPMARIPASEQTRKQIAEVIRECLRDLKVQGMNDPVRVATDGAPGLIRAVEEVFPQSLRQRCLAHKLRNLGRRSPRNAGGRSKLMRSRRTRPSHRGRRVPPPKSSVAATRGSFPAPWPASRTILRRASPTCGYPSPTAKRFGPPTSWSGCSARNAGGPKPPRTPSANGRC